MKRNIPGLLILFLISVYSLTAAEQFIYTRISTREGLASTVNSIYKEKDGDVWLGTPKGLYTFNGHRIKHNEDSLFRDCYIYKIQEDKNGGLWILTDNWVMHRKNGEDRFKQLKADSPYEEAPFFSMCQDEDGIWFGSQGIIYRYTYKDEKLSLFHDLKGHDILFCSYLNKIDDSTLLCSSNGGSVLIDTTTGEITDYDFGPLNRVCGTMTDSRGRLWISFYNNGIRVYEKDWTLIKTYTTRNSDLSNDLALCFTEKDSKIWVGTDGGGVNIIDPENDSIKVISHVSGDASSFPAHSIKTIYTDNYGNIWAGSTRDGLIRVSQSGMKTYSDSHIGMSSGLSNPSAICLFQEDDDRTIWIGTDGEGLNRFDPVSNRFTHYKSTLKTKVISIATYSETELALSLYADQIWLFNKNTGTVRPMPLNDEEIKHFMKYTGRSLILANGKDGSLYMLTNSVRKLDRKSGLCHKIPPQDGVRTFGNIFAIGKSERGLYLHDINSIYKVDEEAGELLNICTLDETIINSGYIGKDGDIWLATDKGLCLFNEDTSEISFIDTNLFQKAVSVVWDGKSKVWIGSDTNLYAYLTERKTFAMFGESDGAVANEYLAKPRLLTNEGEVYMGGVQGLLSIDSEYIIDTSEEPLISLQEISVDRENIYGDKDMTYEIPRDSKVLSISVSTQETDIFRQKMYRFSLAGSGKEYKQKSPTLEIRYLPKPGRYELMVSCTKRNGEWSTPVRLLTLKIPQPWYRSWWFMSIIALCVLCSYFSVTLYLLRRKDAKLQTALREQDKLIYEEKVRMLINISHELRTPLTLIMAPLKRFLDGMKPEDDNFQTMNRIYRQSRRMKDLLNMVLDLRKMEVGMSDLKIVKGDFNGWIRETTEDIVNEEHTQGIEIILDLSPEIGMVDFDRKKCDTVLSNILINAVKHSCDGDIITLKTTLTEDGMVRTSISDQGPGISNMNTDKMFTRFYQSNNEQYGSGIGLSYSKILVELHGGRIAAENNPDKGATFWWEIPVCATVSENQMIPAKAYLNELMGYDSDEDASVPETESFSTAGMTLMLVDDSQDLLDFLKEAMAQEFAEIITSQSGNKAYASLSTEKMPDIIISDVNMPDGDGFRLCRKIKEDKRYSHIPVILLTARGEQQSQSDSYRVGADAFLAKPFEIETLIELTKGMLRKREEVRKRYFDTEDKTVSDYGSNEESFILKLNKVIAEHLDDPDLDQQMICMELGMSRAALFNKMKTITGSGAKEYITKLRLEKAKSLIENSNLTIAEISEKTGFASQSYFSTAFKNYTGMTPSQYKKSGNL